MFAKVWCWVVGLLSTTVLLISPSDLLSDWSSPEQLTWNNGEDITATGSLSIDGNDVLHLAWLFEDPSDGLHHVMFMTNDGMAWGTPIDITPTGGNFSRLDAASHYNGSTHIVYQVQSLQGPEIMYATNQTGSWEIEQVTTNSWDDVTPAVAVDGFGKPNIAWAGYDQETGTGKIHHAYKTSGGTWITEIISESELGAFWTGAIPRIAVAEIGVPHITYRGGGYGNYDVQYATKTGRSWEVRNIPTPNLDDYDTSIRIVPDGTLYLGASGNDGWGMPFRTYYNTSTDGGTTWEGWDLVTGGNGAAGPVLSVGPGAEPHMVWEEVSGNFYTGTIFHSWLETGNWQSEPLTFDNSSYIPSLVTDGSGGQHVVYWSNTYFQSDSAEVYYQTNSDPLVSLTLDPPINFEVHAGESLDFTTTLENRLSIPLTGDLWLDVYLAGPAAEVTIPPALLNIDNPTSGTLPPESSIVLDVTLSIPSKAPVGLFHIVARAGNFETRLAVDEARFAGFIVP